MYLGIGSLPFLALMMNSVCITCIHQLRCWEHFSVIGHSVSLSFSLSVLAGDIWFPWNVFVPELWTLADIVWSDDSVEFYWIIHQKMLFKFRCSSSFCGIHCLILTFLCTTNNKEHIKGGYEVWFLCGLQKQADTAITFMLFVNFFSVVLPNSPYESFLPPKCLENKDLVPTFLAAPQFLCSSLKLLYAGCTSCVFWKPLDFNCCWNTRFSDSKQILYLYVVC